MAFNLASLKGLFSKLKPAAKTIANYGDDVARVAANYGDDVAGIVANYGDDAAKALTTYGDDVARGAIDYVDDFGIRYNTMQDLDNIGRALPVDVDSDFLDAVWDDPGPMARKQNLVDDVDASELLRDAELRREADYWKSIANDAEDDLIYLDRDSLWNTSYGQDPYTPEMRQKSHNLLTKRRLANERADRLMSTASQIAQDDAAYTLDSVAKNRSLRDFYDASHRQRLYDRAVSHGANPKKLDSFLKTTKYNPYQYTTYPELYEADLPF